MVIYDTDFWQIIFVYFCQYIIIDNLGNYDNFDDSEIFVKFSMSVYDCGNFDESEILHKCRQLWQFYINTFEKFQILKIVTILVKLCVSACRIIRIGHVKILYPLCKFAITTKLFIR